MKDVMYGDLVQEKKFKRCIDCKKPISVYVISDMCLTCKKKFLMSLTVYRDMGSRVRVIV